jgi:hypothetical protein
VALNLHKHGVRPRDRAASPCHYDLQRYAALAGTSPADSTVSEVSSPPTTSADVIGAKRDGAIV